MLWNLDPDGSEATRIQTFRGHTNWVYEGAFHPQGKQVVTASFDRTARIWDIATGHELDRFRHQDAVRSVECSADGQTLLTAGWDLTVRFWDLDSGKLVPPFLKDNGRVMHAAFDPAGQRILTVGWNGIVRVWSRQNVFTCPPPIPVLLDPQGTRFLLRTSQHLQSYDVRTGELEATLEVQSPSSARIEFNAEGTHLAALSPPGPESASTSGAREWQAQLWDLEQNRPDGPVLAYDAALDQVELSHSGRYLAVYNRHAVQVWNTHTGTLESTIESTESPITLVRYDRQEERLAVAEERQLKVWSIAGAKPLTPPLSHPVPITQAAFSPDGRFLVTACSDQSLDAEAGQVWDAATGEKIGQPLNHEDGVLYAAFSPDGRKVITTSEDKTAIIWETETGRQLIHPLRHEDQIRYAAFSSAGEWVVTAGQDNVARVWDARTGEAITPPLVHSQAVAKASFIDHERALMTIDTHGDTRIWPLTPENKPLDDLELMAQLFSGQQPVDLNRGPDSTDPGDSLGQPFKQDETPKLPEGRFTFDSARDFRPLTESDFHKIWVKLRSQYPEEFSVRTK